MDKRLEKALSQNKILRVIGVDDAPFEKTPNTIVNISGIICSDTRFEGMLWGKAHKDGADATQSLITMIRNSKFHKQLHLVIIDGIAIGGFNIIDLPLLQQSLALPCIAVMRKMPDLARIDSALKNFDDYETRKAQLQKAGEIYQQQGFVYQVAGCQADTAAHALTQLTDNGKVPEALRLAHLIGSAIKTGQSSNRA